MKYIYIFCQGFWVGAYYERRLSRYLIETYVWKWCIPRNHQFSRGKSGKMVINLWNGRCPSFQQTHLYIGVLFFVMSQDPSAPFHKRHTSRVPIRDHEGLNYCGRDGKTGWLNPWCLPIRHPPIGTMRNQALSWAPGTSKPRLMATTSLAL